MAFKDLFIKEESAPPKQPVVAQEVATRQFIEYSNKLTQHLEEVCK